MNNPELRKLTFLILVGTLISSVFMVNRDFEKSQQETFRSFEFKNFSKEPEANGITDFKGRTAIKSKS